MEYIKFVTENPYILASASCFALLAWGCSNILKIQKYLSKKHNLELIKLKLDINHVYTSLYDDDTLPYARRDIDASIYHCQQHTRIEKILAFGIACITKVFEVFCITIFYGLAAIILLNAPLFAWGNDYINFYQALICELILIVLAFGFKQFASLSEQLYSLMIKKLSTETMPPES